MNQVPQADEGRHSQHVTGQDDAVRGRQAGSRPGRIVVGVDGSLASIEALKWAVRQAELTGASLDAVISWDYPTQYGMEFGAFDVDWEAGANEELTTALHQVFGPDIGAINSRVMRGRPSDVLLTAAAGADLLVVGSRGHGAMAGMLLGSVSEYVVAHSPCPVLVIRDDLGTSSAPPAHEAAMTQTTVG
ncbi:MAG: universal stress protein [Nakamurella sp.]